MSNNLKLGKNEIYRDAIELAAERTKLDPAVIASVIAMEAAGKDGVWDPVSANKRSTARGLTQVLDQNWLGEAEHSGRYLNRFAREQGLVDARNNVLPDKRDELLKLRQDPKIAIVAAAEYDVAVYRELVQKGVFDPDAEPEQLARDLYAGHLLGVRGATEYVERSTSPAAAHARLTQNGQNIAAALSAHAGDLSEAWHAFVDTRLASVDPDRFRGPALEPSLPAQQAATELAR
jgi:hypothetical protein